MGSVNINGSNVGSALTTLLLADDIEPGDDPSYQLCKVLFLYHPLGAKMVEAPIKLAQSQKRKITIPNSPEERVRNAFIAEWRRIGADEVIANTKALSRVYGVASVACLEMGKEPKEALDFDKLAKAELAFNVYDPLNTAGSLVLNQNTTDIDFLKYTTITTGGKTFHRSRTCVMLNEKPVYLAYTSSAFGYVGRSVYQRPLFPLKSFVQTMITDDLVARKAGVLVAMMKTVGSVVSNLMAAIAGIKRNLLKEAETTNVISIDSEEKVESLNFQNLDGPLALVRKNILDNIATATPMPAKLLNQETFAEGFGEGTEDAKQIAKYIEGFREEMEPLYAYFDKIVQHRAWNDEFYATIQKDFPKEYGEKPYKQAFYEWVNAFHAEWPNLLEEPDSEKATVDDVKLKALIAAVEVMLPEMDPVNKATLLGWMQDNFNELKLLFPNPLELDLEALKDHAEEAAQQAADLQAQGQEDEEQAPKKPKPFDRAA